MKVSRGDIVTAEYPNSSGVGSKLRPVLIIQDDFYNHRIQNVIVANVTSNLKNAKDKAHYLIEINTSEGISSGLNRDCEDFQNRSSHHATAAEFWNTPSLFDLHLV